MRRAKQFIFVTRDSFSDFVASTFIKSESANDLKEGLIQTTSTVRRNSSISVRVDQAPGFVSLKKSNDKDLAKLNIVLDLSDPENKNGVAIVDKAIQELEKEIVKISPEGKSITTSELAQATLALNSRIRNRDLSSHEILFSREQNTGDNINLDDESLARSKMEKKENNHKYSEKSKFDDCKNPISADALKGDRVYLKKEGGKHNVRDLYVVIKSDAEEVTIVKLLHAHDIDTKTKLGSKEIKAKQIDIYRADSNRRDEKEHLEEEPVEEKQVIVKRRKSTFRKTKRNEVHSNNWSPFLKEETSSESEDSGDSTIASEDEETDSSIESVLMSDVSNSTDRTESDPDDFIDIQLDDLFVTSNETSSVDITTDPNDQSGNTIVTIDDNPEDLENAGGEEQINVDVEPLDHDNNELFDILGPNPLVMPNHGEKIAYFDPNIHPRSIVLATVLPMFKTVQRKWPSWINISEEVSGHKSSIDLSLIRWKFLENENVVDDRVPVHENDDEAHVQVDHHNEALRVVDNPLQMAFPEVRNLEDMLPLSSTPASAIPAADGRLSAVRPRGLLPMEIEDSPLHRPQGSRIQQALTRRADQVRRILSRNSSDSSN